MLPILAGALQIIPGLAGLIGGGKAEAVAQKVTDVVSVLTNTDDPIKGLEAIEKDPELAAQFRIAVMEHALSLYEIEVADRKDARAMNVSLAEKGDHTSSVLAFTIMFGFLGAILLIIGGSMFGISALKDPTLAALIGSVIGQLGNLASGVKDFFFGSSKDGQERDKTIQQIAKMP